MSQHRQTGQQPGHHQTGEQYAPTQQGRGQGGQQSVQGQQSTLGQQGQQSVQTQQGQQSIQGQQMGAPRQPRQFQSASYLSPDVREQVVQCLTRTLADATVLQTHARYAHWNVKGMSFHGLHETFEDIVEALEDHIDLIGERITALGGQAMGTAGMAVSSCRLPQMPQDVYTGPQFVDVMVDRMAVFDACLYQDIQTATQLEDLDTADLLNEVSREVSKLRWFLEAHRQTQPIGTVGQGVGTSPHAQGVGTSPAAGQASVGQYQQGAGSQSQAAWAQGTGGEQSATEETATQQPSAPTQ